MAIGNGQEPAGPRRSGLHSRLTRRGLAPALALVAGDAGRSRAAAHVPLVLAMATTRAALHSSAGATAAAAPVSASIALLLQRELSSLLIAKIRLAAGGAAAVAGAAAILIGVTLAGPTLGHSQGIGRVDDKAQASEGIAQNVARPVRTIARGIGGSTPAGPIGNTGC